MADRQSDTPIVLGCPKGQHTFSGVPNPGVKEGVYKDTGHAKEKRWTASERRASKQQPVKSDRNTKQLLQTSLHGISNAAKRCLARRFTGLYSFFNRYNFETAYHSLNKRAATGVDKVTYQEYGKDLHRNVVGLEERMKAKRYRAKLVRRAFIPKANGKTRPLGIPALEDKVVQQVAKEILDTLFEPNFLDSSYGYRSGRSAKQAALTLQKRLHQGKFGWVVEADIKGFFDNIDHEWLIKALEKRVNDGSFIRLIRKWLKAGVLQPDGAVEHPEKGTPQGGIVSPVLANIYLHYVLDLWFEQTVKPGCRGQACLIRYADDFVAAFQYHRDAQRYNKALGLRFGKVGLELAKEKTAKLVFSRFRKEQSRAFSFLGFTYRWTLTRKGKDTVRMTTSRRKFQTMTADFKTWCKENAHRRMRWLMPMAKAKLTGIYNYFGVIGNAGSLTEIFEVFKRKMFQCFNRRSQRRSYNWRTFAVILQHHKIFRYRHAKKGTNQLSLWSVCG